MISPAFQFYPADYLADMRVRMLSWAGRGVYMDLLCYCWREGWIPADSSAIAQLLNCHDTATVESCLLLFVPMEGEPSKLVHPRLDKEREKQRLHREERVASGAKGANKRWSRQRKNGSANGSATPEPIAKNGSSSSTSSSLSTASSSSKSKGTLVEVQNFCAEESLPDSDALACFYKWEGNGWTNGGKPIKDWKATIRSWRAARLLPSQKVGGMNHVAPKTGPSRPDRFEDPMEKLVAEAMREPKK